MSNIHVGLRILTSQSEETSLNNVGHSTYTQKIHALELKLKKKKKRERERDETNNKP